MATALDDLAPLSARSAILSLLLGAHPSPLTPADLARAGQLLDIAPATVRVAAARAVADGDLSRAEDGYRLGERLIQRQAHQDEAVHTADKAWDGSWEMTVVVAAGRPGPERAVLRDALKSHRLAELREGVWTRPANLRRPRFSDPVLQTFTATPEQDPGELAASLWDLAGWTREAEHLLERLDSTTQPALRLATAAAIVRHIDADPLLPPDLRPSRWPAAELRETYDAYQRELSDLVTLA
ncbi:phenylacetic acid degradation operon negative regulatory protein [Nocardioides luteus]|uniref:PaaX domain-containing protein, C-domain protein n=1 Tax=Nocardioides luteus TaxID=1844 RepID=A0ABQ5SXY6_9ACTN|nr:PaaX domain-containing protein, C- domain protein [Nocardioides luteus]MDR7312637.1 phenylacetic acid degradation operon negative regulatory protein [Nocardioides luteus]GGR46498.1 hypothetical protein GCM10010197_10210 [Nocardioides luteus]GLJ68885.1 hypothetical protein GCM10017579_29210 [Nocardioides luteus]